MSATIGGQTVIGYAYEANPEDTKSPGLRFARHIATTNLTYPAGQPPQPPTTITIVLTHYVDGVATPIVGGPPATACSRNDGVSRHRGRR